MIHFRAPFLGGVCSLGLMFQLASVDIVHAATTVEVSGVRADGPLLAEPGSIPMLADSLDVRFGAATDASAIEVAEDTDTPPATGGQATTEFFGDSASPDHPAWAAPATLNPEYAAGNAAEASDAAESGSDTSAAAAEGEAAAAPAEMAEEDAASPPTGGKASTEFYGDAPATETPAWAAPAKMNPDYATTPSAPADAAAPAATDAGEQAAPGDGGSTAGEAPAPAAASEEPAPPPTGGQATTDYYGGSPAPENPAWDAPAKMNPDYDAAAAPAPAASSSAAASADACLEAVVAAAKAATLNFGMDSASIAPDSRVGLRALAKAMADCGGAVVEVQGFTDNIGPEETNRLLSELRAKEVIDFLKDAGVDAAKLKAVGRGEDHPVGDNGTVEGRRANRRVEFVVSGQ